MDFGGSLRCGTSALLAALDAAKRPASRASRSRPKRDADAGLSAEELTFGDAAVAVRIGR